MSSDDEDTMPLARRNRGSTNGAPVSAAIISPSLDRKLDAEQMDIDGEHAPGIATTKELNKVTNGKRRASQQAIYKEDSDSDVPLNKKRKAPNGVKKTKADESDDDVPLSKSRGAPATNGKKIISSKIEDSDSDDIPLHQKLAVEKQQIQKQQAKDAKKAREEVAKAKVKKEEQLSDDDDVPLAKKRKVTKKAVKEEESDSDIPMAKKRKTATPQKKANGVKKEETTSTKKITGGKDKAANARVAKTKKEEKAETPAFEEDDGEVDESEEYKWWQAQQSDGKTKWTTLEHRGVLLAPPYVPLPNNVKMKYDGVPIVMAPEAEEVAGFMAQLIKADQAKDKKFTENFFNDWTKVLKDTGGAKDKNGTKVVIKSYDKCDFNPVWEHYDAIKTAQKALPLSERKKIKAEKAVEDEPYTFCELDGRKEKVGNFRIEPPGLFRGRGDHPKRGMLKKRIQPEQITINIGKTSKVPVPPKGHSWAKVQHNNEVAWLATWTENINGNVKYVMLGATSSLKGMSDFKKFEKARELKLHIDKIRRDYTKDLKDPHSEDRQRATAVYLIDQFALRAGNDKDSSEEADTVGCCSLRYEHVTLQPPNEVVFDFLGKDSIRFHQSFNVAPQVFKNMKIFKKAPKKHGDDLFDRLDPSKLNKWFKNYMDGLTAKVFRTYNASYTMQQELLKLENKGTVIEKITAYNDANRKVAIICNHQRAVAKNHDDQLGKMDNEIKGLMYTKWRLKKMILDLEPKLKKKKPEYFERDPEIDDDDWVKSHQEWLIEQEKVKIEKKFAKENEKLVEGGEKPMKDSELKSRMEVLKEMKKEFAHENKTGKITAQGKAPTVEKFEAQIQKIDERIFTKTNVMKDKDNNKEVSLGTSKINYIDPRLTVVFCKKFDVPLEKLFPKTLREKFQWAIDSADEDWVF